MDELRAHLLDLHKDLVSGGIPCVHKVGELSVVRSAPSRCGCWRQEAACWYGTAAGTTGIRIRPPSSASRLEAVDYAVKIASPAAAEVVVHKKDGSVAERIRPKARSLTR